MESLLLLLTMVFCHIVDDYYLQSILAQMKQKNWWEKNYPNQKYKNDYSVALAEHAFSWTFMIHVPVVVYLYLKGVIVPLWLFVTIFSLNFVVHAFTDNAKCNLYKLNLVQDQLIHLAQILVTGLIYISF